MQVAHASSAHSFAIPVMGTGFTLDSPLRIGRYGISSTMSAVDDVLMERVRQAWLARAGRPYEPIEGDRGEARAQRVEAYLNFVSDVLSEQMERLRNEPFLPGSDICRYFQLLPACPLKQRYEAFIELLDGPEREREEAALRAGVAPGDANVNIMTKVDRRTNRHGVELSNEDSDALSALRGFARSRLRGAVVLSAGMNPRLFGYAAQFDCFLPDETGEPQKQIILKVSDHRSAVVQGTVLAKKGLWVSEFRVESGLNCGGHAFANGGLLLGPILEDFRRDRVELRGQLFTLYRTALMRAGRMAPEQPLTQRLTVQGGIGTYAEDEMLRAHYGVDATGWGSPFLLVDDATAVDSETRERLCEAKSEDVRLSNASPLGVRFWNLSTSASERARRDRIAAGKPGSLCPKGFLATTDDNQVAPSCLASRSYQRARLRRLEEEGKLSPAEREQILEKACICHDLGGSIARVYGFDDSATPAICPGPNIVHFRRELTLEELVGHIYGRNDVLVGSARPHMFLSELRLNLDYLDELEREAQSPDARTEKQLRAYRDNLREGIAYYLANLHLFGNQQGAAEGLLHEWSR